METKEKKTRKANEKDTQFVPAEIQPTQEAPEPKKMHVFFSGPIVDSKPSSQTADNRTYWVIKVSHNLDELPKYFYRVWSWQKASALAAKIAADQNLEIISSATPE